MVQIVQMMGPETRLLLHSFLLGAALSMVYSLLLMLRRLIGHSRLAVSCEDLLFWGFSGSQIFLLLYYESDGVIRWFTVMGLLCGAVTIYNLIGSRFSAKKVTKNT